MPNQDMLESLCVQGVLQSSGIREGEFLSEATMRENSPNISSQIRSLLMEVYGVGLRGLLLGPMPRFLRTSLGRTVPPAQTLLSSSQ